MKLNKTIKTLFAAALLLSLNAPIASAALSSNLAPVSEPSVVKTVIDPITKEPVLINTASVYVDSSKIYRSAATKSSGKLPTSATFKIIETKKTAPLGDASNNKSASLADPVSAGLNYLFTSQAADGSWSHNGKIKNLETASVAKLLNNLNQRVGASSTEQMQIDQMRQKSVDWLRFSFPESNDYLADKIATLSGAGDDMADSMDFLASQINDSSLGFGIKKNYGADIFTTAKVLDALAVTNYQDPGADSQFTLKAALLYLLNYQNLDGGWPEISGEDSSLYATNVALQSLFPFRNVVIQGMPNGDVLIPTKINLGLNYLKNRQYFYSGAWQDDILETALSYHNLISYNNSPNYNQKAIDYLKNAQNPDGSFSTPGFTKTAKAIEALAKPDITVTDIQNPISVPDPNATLWVTVKNDGYLSSNPLNLALPPAAFSLKIDGQNIPLDFTGAPPALIFEPNSAVIFEIHFNQNLFGQHSVYFKADYADPEFWKNNNDLTEGIAFGTPQFSGPTPPPWIGASSGPTSGEITLRWQQSSDPTRDHYVLFGSTASGQYDFNSPLYVFPPGNFAGINFYFDPSLYNIPLYFTIVSYDSSGNHGNLAPESWAVAYGNPENYRGTLSGAVRDLATNQKIPNAEIDFYLINTFYSDGAGDYFINYYPGFYLTSVWKQNYYSYVGSVQITTQSATSIDFVIRSSSSGTYPAPVTGLYGSAGNNQVTLNWNPYSPPSDFKQFDIFRSNYSFGGAWGLTPIATISDPSATSFTDTSVINGVNYFYAVAPENNSGSFPDAPSVGPFRPGSGPAVDNVSASQSGGDVLITYNLQDSSGKTSFVSFEYWNGSTWIDAATTIGEGMQSPGIGKTGSWRAKQDFPDWDGQIKIRIRAYQDPAPVYSESPLFNLDTKNPAPPTVYALPATTGLFQKTLGGIKETNTAIKSEGAEIVPQSSSTSWEYPVALRQGLNQFSFTAIDATGNESASSSVSTTYDPNFFICGDVNGDESLDVFDMTLLIDVIFSGHTYPAHPSSMDVNNDGQYDVFDLINLINFIFSGGHALSCPAA